MVQISAADALTHIHLPTHPFTEAIAAVIGEAKDGAVIAKLCKMGDDLINA